jgi:hypothetical protein
MSATSINIQPVKGGSEIHNFREKDLSYVRSELSHLNESWTIDSISNRLSDIKERYQNNTGQRMQKKATPIREGVIVIEPGTSMDQLRDFATRCEERFGIKTFQIHMHKDEGHMNSKEWKPNLHAHIVFDWTQENGKSVKLNRQDMAEMQTMLSDALGMQRGKSSDREHLNAIQFKAEQEVAKIQKLQKEAKSIEVTKSVKSTVFKASERIRDFVGVSVNDKEKDALRAENKALTAKLEKAISDNRLLNENLILKRRESKLCKSELDKAIEVNKSLRNYITAVKKELKSFGSVFSEEQKQAIKSSFPNVHKAMDFAGPTKKQQSQNKGRGMGI